MTAETVPAPSAPARPVRTSGRPAAHSLTVEIRSDVNLSIADRVTVRALIDARPEIGIFLSPAWLSALFAEPPDGVEPCLAIMRDGERLRGLAPLAIARDGGRVRIRLMGGGRQSDRTDLLAERGCETACADALLSWMTSTFGAGGFVLELRDVPHDSALWAGMLHLDPSSRVIPTVREISPGPYLDLREYRSGAAARLGPAVAFEKSLARHRRWLEQRGHLRVDVLRDAGEALAAFDTLTRLLHERWKAHGGRSALDRPWKQRFHHRAIPLLLAEGHLQMVRVSVDLRPIAVAYGLAAGDWWGSYQLGYDREWGGRIHVGLVSFAIAMEVAAQNGAGTFDFLKGAEPVKYRWPVRDRITVDADVYSARAVPQLARAGRASRDLVAALAGAAQAACRRAAGLVPGWTP